jgi:hypothetical protein
MATRPGNGQQTAPPARHQAGRGHARRRHPGLAPGCPVPAVVLARRGCHCPGGREPGAGPGAAQLGGPWSDHRRPGRRRDRPAHDRALLDGFDRLSRPQVLGRAWSSAGGPGGATPRLDQPHARPGQGGAGAARCRPVKRQCPAPRHSSAGTLHPLPLDGVPSGLQAGRRPRICLENAVWRVAVHAQGCPGARAAPEASAPTGMKTLASQPESPHSQTNSRTTASASPFAHGRL